MKLQVLSDLHYDCIPKKQRDQIIGDLFSKKADYIVLAGDVCESTELRPFLNLLAETKKKAIFVPGNHDLYHKHVTDAKYWIKMMFQGEGHIVLWNNHVVVEDLVFIGGTLWTDISHPVNANAVQMGMNDFRRIRGIGVNWWQNQHLTTSKYIEDALKLEQFKDLKRIVVTHHSPSFKTCPERFKFDGLNIAFHSNQEHLMLEEWSPDIWIHGHVHDFCDMVVGRTRLVRNPFGYVAYGEKDSGFKKDFLIDTEDANSYLHPDQLQGGEKGVEDYYGLFAEVPDV